METISANLLFILVVITTYHISKNIIFKFLKGINLVATNYRGKVIINGAGILLLFPSLAGTIVILIFENNAIYILLSFVLLILSLSGLFDDIMGQSSAKGLVGHLKSLISGELSTGIIKAVIGLAVGTLIALFYYSSILEVFIDILVFSLSVNFINLLDLRPGRAAKIYFIFTIFLLIVSKFIEPWMIFSTYIVLFFYLNGEMKELYMLGDAGTSILGGSIGFYSVLVLPLTVKVILGFMLIIIHILTEYYSLSRIIDRIPTLRRLDRLGRKD